MVTQLTLNICLQSGQSQPSCHLFSTYSFGCLFLCCSLFAFFWVNWIFFNIPALAFKLYLFIIILLMGTVGIFISTLTTVKLELILYHSLLVFHPFYFIFYAGKTFTRVQFHLPGPIICAVIVMSFTSTCSPPLTEWRLIQSKNITVRGN